MKTIVFASGNKHKIAEVKEILNNFKILSLNDIGFKGDIEETGKTFLENAVIKAKAVSQFLKKQGKNFDVLSDDSGLCVQALSGEPGIFSARYCGNHNDEANRKKVLLKLENAQNRTAHFECVVAMVKPSGNYVFGTGKTLGKITQEEIGDKSFGYDCIFYSDDLQKTFGEATANEKNSVSHRNRAILDLLNKQH